MKQRIFKAKTMAEAVTQVKQTLGEDAIIVSVRQVLLEPAWKIWQTPGVEVLAVKRGDARDEALLTQLQSLAQKKITNPPASASATPARDSEKTAAQNIQPNSTAANLDDKETQQQLAKKTPKTDSRSLNLQAFQAALRRANVEKSPSKEEGNQQPAQEETPELKQPDKEIEVLLSDPEVLKKIKEAPQPSGQKTDNLEPKEEITPSASAKPITEEESNSDETVSYAALDLTPPKPKLALQELKEALLSQSKPSAKPAISKPLEELAENLRKQSQPESSSPPTPIFEPPAAPASTSSDPTRSADSTVLKPHRKPRWHYRPSPEAQRELLNQSKEAFILPKKLAEAKEFLLNQGVDSVVVEKAIKCCHESLSPQSLGRDDILQDVLKKQLEAKIHVFSESALKAHHHIVTIGPSGAGKTSFTGKLAAHIKLRRGEKVIWVSADTVRTGAIAETRVFTELLDIPLILVYEPEELHQVIENIDPNTIVLIDTPACNPYREESLVELGSLLEVLHKKITYMALPATMKELDITQTLAAYTLFHIDGFVITKMDETCQYGAVYNAVWRSKLPIAYLTHGIDLLDGLSIADPSILSKALFGEPFLRSI